MANLIHSGKKAVDLVAPTTRVSRIRRDPPPVKPVTAADIRDRDARDTVIGVITIALALLLVLFGLTNAAGWSPSQYTVNIR